MWDEYDDAREAYYECDAELYGDEEDVPMEYGGYIGDEAEWARDYDKMRF